MIERCNPKGKIAVYVARMPERFEIKELAHTHRRAEVSAASSEKVKREKYFSWKLMEYALSECFGEGISDSTLSKNRNGKWISPDFSVSLSHSENVAAIALSDKQFALGVDIEFVKERKNSDALARRIMNEAQISEYGSISDPAEAIEYLIGLWTAKEASFKLSDKSAFLPSAPVEEGVIVKTECISFKGGRYVLYVACNEKIDVEIKIINEAFYL